MARRRKWKWMRKPMKCAPTASCWCASRPRYCRWRSATFCFERPDIMLTLNTKLDRADQVDGELILQFELREKSRLRAHLASGEEVAVFTVRGTVLRHGDLLRGDDGRVVRIVAADEATYRVD